MLQPINDIQTRNDEFDDGVVAIAFSNEYQSRTNYT
jgi:hypothetical protein